MKSKYTSARTCGGRASNWVHSLLTSILALHVTFYGRNMIWFCAFRGQCHGVITLERAWNFVHSVALFALLCLC